MQLLLRRSHRRGLFDRAIYTLDVRAQFDWNELTGIFAYGLAGTRLYQRLEVADQGSGILGVLFRLSFKAANLTVSVRDLIDGKRIECANIGEMLAAEDQIRESARTFSQLLAAATHFDGDEAINL